MKFWLKKTEFVRQGWGFTKLLTKICKIFLNFEL